jgi:hypothetical protein
LRSDLRRLLCVAVIGRAVRRGTWPVGGRVRPDRSGAAVAPHACSW